MVQSTDRSSHFIPPGVIARAANRFYGWLTAMGLSLPDSYLLAVAGRKTGKLRSLPVNVLDWQGRLFLVATRGHTQWARNAGRSRRVILRRGRQRKEFGLRALDPAQKPEVLKAYLTRFYWMVWRFFPVRADAPLASFAAIAERYPVFELLEVSPSEAPV